MIGGAIGGGTVTVVAPADLVLTGGGIGGGALVADGVAEASATGGGKGGGTVFFEETVVDYGEGGGTCGGGLDYSAAAEDSGTGGGMCGGALVAEVEALGLGTGGGTCGGTLTYSASASALTTGGGTGGGTLTCSASAVQSATGGGKGGGTLQTDATSPMQSVWHDEGTVVSGNGIVLLYDTTQNFAYQSYQNSPANGDIRDFRFFLPAGSYTLNVLTSTQNARGKVEVSIDFGSVLATWDLYSASSVFNVVQTLGITISTTGVHTLRFKVNGKNASSSNYFFAFTKFWFL